MTTNYIDKISHHLSDLKSFSTCLIHFIENVELLKINIPTVEKITKLINVLYEQIETTDNIKLNISESCLENSNTVADFIDYDDSDYGDDGDEGDEGDDDDSNESLDDYTDLFSYRCSSVKPIENKESVINLDDPKLKRFIDKEFDISNIIYYKKTEKPLKQLNKFVKSSSSY